MSMLRFIVPESQITEVAAPVDPIVFLNRTLDIEAQKDETAEFEAVVLGTIIVDDRYDSSLNDTTPLNPGVVDSYVAGLAKTTKLNPEVVAEHQAKRDLEA